MLAIIQTYSKILWQCRLGIGSVICEWLAITYWLRMLFYISPSRKQVSQFAFSSNEWMTELKINPEWLWTNWKKLNTEKFYFIWKGLDCLHTRLQKKTAQFYLYQKISRIDLRNLYQKSKSVKTFLLYADLWTSKNHKQQNTSRC